MANETNGCWGSFWQQGKRTKNETKIITQSRKLDNAARFCKAPSGRTISKSFNRRKKRVCVACGHKLPHKHSCTLIESRVRFCWTWQLHSLLEQPNTAQQNWDSLFQLIFNVKENLFMKRSPVLEDECFKFLNDFTPVVNQQEWVEEFCT